MKSGNNNRLNYHIKGPLFERQSSAIDIFQQYEDVIIVNNKILEDPQWFIDSKGAAD
jgi:hypothetical protein